MGKTVKADRMMDMRRGKRFTAPKAVLAYERDRTVCCRSMAEAMLRYDIPSTSMLERLIANGSTWQGYTTFDWASDEDYRRSAFKEFGEIVSDAVGRLCSNRDDIGKGGR